MAKKKAARAAGSVVSSGSSRAPRSSRTPSGTKAISKAGAKAPAKSKAASPAKPRKTTPAKTPSKPAPAAGPRTPLLRAMLAISLDGYIADAGGNVEWLNPFMSPEIDFPGFMRTIGATIYGRTTFDWAVKHGFLSTGDNAGGKVVVMTRRPIENLPPGVEIFDGDVRELAARLKAELAGAKEVKDIWLMGGGLSIAPFHEAGLVDRWEISIIPVLLGEGIPLFPRRSHAVESLTLVKSRTLSNGIVEGWYVPKKA